MWVKLTGPADRRGVGASEDNEAAARKYVWVIEGAAVSVSIVCFAANGDQCAESSVLDGRAVRAIRSDLRDIDLAFDLRSRPNPRRRLRERAPLDTGDEVADRLEIDRNQ